MPSSDSSNACKTKSRKSESKCCPPSPCEIDCCAPEKQLDCCTIPYQRLEKVRKAWSTISATGSYNFLPTEAFSTSQINNVFTRGGSVVAVPETGSLYTNGEDSIATFSSGFINILLNLAYYGYLFVQTHRYLNFEACGKLDQVVGWYVNTANGELELFQSLPDLNLLITDTRYYLDNQPVISLSSTDKAKLYALNVLYKASVRAIEAVGQNPKEEGNIVTVTDKCGQKWLMAINRAQSPNPEQSICSFNNQYVIVAIPLC
jgi:hypothetical protein